MPEEGITLLKHSDILTFNEIIEFTKTATQLGITKVRITGGEPLVRKGIIDLVKQLAQIDEIADFAMTTNGILLKQFAKPLYEAGLMRINVSLDTMNPDKYSAITRGGNLSSVLEGLHVAKSIGFKPIKLNCVINKSSKEVDAIEVKNFALQNGFEARFIPLMDLDKGIHGIVEGGDGGNCSICNRIRLTANGLVKPCLFSDIGFNVRELGAKQAIIQAIESKPKSGTTSIRNKFYNIGG